MSEYAERHERGLREFDIAEGVLRSARQICLLAEARSLRELSYEDTATIEADDHYLRTLRRCRKLIKLEAEMDKILEEMRLEL